MLVIVICGSVFHGTVQFRLPNEGGPIDTKIAVSPAACALQLKMVPRFLLETLKELIPRSIYSNG
jgi:hypothetical protein